MIKKTVSYQDYNNKPVSEDLWFHLKMDTITDNLHLGDRLEALQELFEGEQRELTTAEKQEILDVVKLFINLSYGVRVENGAKFRQRPELVDDFRDSAAYDAFLWALFQDPKGAMSFLTDVMPQDLVEKARQAEEANGPKRPQDRQQKQAAGSNVPTVSASKTVLFDDSQVDDGAETAEEKRQRLQAELAALEA